MAAIAVSREDDGRRGRYVARMEGIDAEAELTYVHTGPGLVSANHVGAPMVLRGTGVAGALVDQLVSDARAMSFRIIPVCPYIRARYLRHPEWRDVMSVAPGEAP